MLIFIIFFALWVLLNGRVTPDVLGTGAVISAVVTLFALKICGWEKLSSKKLLKISGKGLKYIGSVVIEIVKANIAMIQVILSKNCCSVRPQLLFFDSRLHTETGQTFLADAITITPGTFTLGIYGSTLAVHAINEEFADGTPDSGLNRQLIALEEAYAEEKESAR